MPSHSIVDLTHPLTSHTQIYPGDPPFLSTPHCTIPSDGASVHKLSLGTHTGTHIDAPSHFIPNGKHIGQIPLSSLVSLPALIIDLSKKELGAKQEITWEEHLNEYKEEMNEDKVVIIHTGWSRFWGTKEYFHHPYLTKNAALRMVDRGVRILAVDTASPDGTSGDGEFGVHKVMLGAGGLIVENLTNVERLVDDDGEAGNWLVSFVPLYLGGEEDGSPIRAFAERVAGS